MSVGMSYEDPELGCYPLEQCHPTESSASQAQNLQFSNSHFEKVETREITFSNVF